MIDELWKERQDRFWDRLGRAAARIGCTPDGVTLAGFAASLLNSALFAWHRDPLAYGIAMALVELLDNLDGGIARATGRSTRWGSFLDATTDRYKEGAALFAIGWVTGAWVAAFLAVTGSFLVSYAQARAGSSPRPASGVPALFERFERVATLVVGLVLEGLWPHALGASPLLVALWLLAVLSHLTALQRIARARAHLRSPGASDEAGPA